MSHNTWASQVALVVNNPQAMQETLVTQVHPWLGKPHRGGNGNSLQCSCLENPQGQRSLVEATVHGVAKSQTRLSD